MAEGWITIGTELATDKFDKQIVELEKKIKKEEDKKLVIGAQLDSQTQELADAREKTDKLADAYQRLDEAQKQVASGKATPQQFSTMQELQGTYGSLEKINSSFDKALSKQDAISQKVENTKLRYNEINAKVTEYKRKIESINLQKHQVQVKQVGQGFKKVGSSIQDAVRRAGNLVLGIFAIRSAYLALSRASSNLASYDKQYAANIEYIKYVLTQAIAPVLQYIVNLAATLLGYINAIVNAWFGINLFSKGSAENFNKMKAGASGTAKAAKEIKKQLAGFDEINVLTDQSDTGTSAGAGGVAPSFDLSGIQGDRPEWLQWIADNKDLVIKALVGIAAGIALITNNSKALLELGIFMIIKGIVDTVKAIVDFIKDPSWKNFGEILEGLSEILFGVALAMLAVNAANPTAWIILLIALVVLLVAEIIKHWDEIKETLGKVGDWINENVIQPVAEFFKGLWDKIKEIFAPVIDFFKSIWDTVKENIKITIDNMKQIFSFLWDKIKEIFSPVIDWFREKFQKAYEKIKEVFSPIANFFGEIWDKVKNKLRDFGAKVGEVVGGAFKTVVNGVITVLERTLNSPINAINNLIDVINNVPGLHLTRLRTFSLPRLKTGGIVNMPNTGTIVGGAIAGESGREGVVPLTDSQAMEELGRTIGKYITVNANITNTMNGRVISRELKQVQSEQNFAYNT